MKASIPAAAAAALSMLASATAVPAQDYPTFERDGYPLTPLQLQVLGSDHVRERAVSSTLERGGMPASPHQLSVLRRTTVAVP